MPRTKRGTVAHKRRKNLLKNAKGFRWGRKNKFKAAKEALMKAWSYAYRDRKKKKREMRKMWNISINAACRKNSTTYHNFIYNLKKKNIELDRKVLSRVAKEFPESFQKIVKEVEK